jgi:hypothetical protein
MAIFKAKVESQFAVIPNAALQDQNLSYEATGLLAMMLSLPDNWEIHKSWLQKQKLKCGRDKLTAIMNELIDNGYVRKVIKQTEDGKLNGVDWLVYPEAVQLKNRQTVKPSDGKSDTIKETSIQKKDNNSLVPAEPKRKKFKFSDDDLKASEWMRDRVVMVNPAAPKCNLESWANTIRLMREMDGHSHREILEVFKWANLDSFWCNNIQSPEKLRKQFGNLKGRMTNEATKPANVTKGSKSAADAYREKLRSRQHADQVRWDGNENSGMDSIDVLGGVQSQVEARGTTISLEAEDWEDVTGAD